MKKYLFIFKSEVMSDMQYVFNTFVGFIGYFILLFILFNLYSYLYTDSSEIINGYTMNQMIWYVIVTEILWTVLSGKRLCRKISNDVKSGNIAYNMNKPYSYIGYALFGYLGEIFIKAITYVVLAAIMGFIFLGSFPNLSIMSILAVLLTGVLATVISIMFIITIGLLSFYIEDSGPIYWVYSKLILVLGTIFPIEYFPIGVQKVLSYSPIYVVSYGPAKLFVDFSFDTFKNIFIYQLIYLLIAYLLASFIYKKGVKKLNVNGG